MTHMPPNCQRFRTRDEWLKARASSIGGSDLALILGKAKFGTLDELFDRMMGKPQKEEKPTERMIEGTLTEESIRKLFSFDFPKYKVIEPPKKGNWLWKKPGSEFIHCSPDGILIEKDTRRFGGLEIKNVELAKKDDIDMWGSNQLPEQYYWQCIQYMLAIPSLEFVVLYAHLKYLFPFGNGWETAMCEDRPFFIRRADESTQKAIRFAFMKESEFYERYVKTGKRPALTIKL